MNKSDGNHDRVAGPLQRGVMAILVMGLLSGAFLGCQSAPRGHSGGVIDPDRRTAVDRHAREADTVSMREFSQQTGEALAMRIGRVPEIAESDHNVAVYMGRIENRTHTPTSDFHMMMRQVFTAMVNNDFVARYADVYESRRTMNERRRRMGYDQEEDLFQEGGGDDGVALYEDEYVYEIQGYFGETVRGGGVQSNYYLELSLVNLASGRIVFVEQYDWKQIR